MRRPTAHASLICAMAALALAVVVAAPGVAHESPPPGAGSVDSRQFFARPPLIMPAAAFSALTAPRPSGQQYFFNVAGGYIRGGYVCVTAPVYLPQNARVTRVDASLYDGEAGASARVYLYRVSNFVQSATEMAYLQTPKDDARMQIVIDRSINAPRIRYPEYAYYAFACLDTANTRLYSVRIHYDVQVYLPAVMRNGR